jgi:hypothetical protein
MARRTKGKRWKPAISCWFEPNACFNQACRAPLLGYSALHAGATRGLLALRDKADLLTP